MRFHICSWARAIQRVFGAGATLPFQAAQSSTRIACRVRRVGGILEWLLKPGRWLPGVARFSPCVECARVVGAA